MMFRLTLGLILSLAGGALVGNAFLFHLSLPALPGRLIAAVIGFLILGTGIYLIARLRASGFSASANTSLSVALGDVFTVFGLASLSFNTLMMVLGRCDLGPTFDGLHLIPAMLVNEVWEGLISASGGSFLLTASGLALFDACIGCLIGMLLFPLQRIAPMRLLWIIVVFICFAVFEVSVISWMPFRC
ncbi:MAG: hypothetical protein U1E05_10710 [Patescibacteria group bacterium]|nr:hypothetical protein [Patescibacteria group bacterium]